MPSEAVSKLAAKVLRLVSSGSAVLSIIERLQGAASWYDDGVGSI